MTDGMQLASYQRGSIFEEEGHNALCYVIPRQDDVILGGTAQFFDEDKEGRAHETESILTRCAEVVPAFKQVQILEVKVGLRPFRHEVRLELQEMYNGLKVLGHNYGHGGSGWTLSWGCAKELADLLLAHLAAKPLFMRPPCSPLPAKL